MSCDGSDDHRVHSDPQLHRCEWTYMSRLSEGWILRALQVLWDKNVELGARHAAGEFAQGVRVMYIRTMIREPRDTSSEIQYTIPLSSWLVLLMCLAQNIAYQDKSVALCSHLSVSGSGSGAHRLIFRGSQLNLTWSSCNWNLKGMASDFIYSHVNVYIQSLCYCISPSSPFTHVIHYCCAKKSFEHCHGKVPLFNPNSLYLAFIFHMHSVHIGCHDVRRSWQRRSPRSWH